VVQKQAPKVQAVPEAPRLSKIVASCLHINPEKRCTAKQVVEVGRCPAKRCTAKQVVEVARCTAKQVVELGRCTAEYVVEVGRCTS